jgi:hypothetical protein
MGILLRPPTAGDAVVLPFFCTAADNGAPDAADDADTADTADSIGTDGEAERAVKSDDDDNDDEALHIPLFVSLDFSESESRFK